jgi:hypothetical protein
MRKRYSDNKKRQGSTKINGHDKYLGEYMSLSVPRSTWHCGNILEFLMQTVGGSPGPEIRVRHVTEGKEISLHKLLFTSRNVVKKVICVPLAMKFRIQRGNF